MRLLGNLKIRSKLFLMLLFPLAGLLYVSAVGVWEKWQQVGDMRSLQTVSEVSVRISALVHEFQKERGMTAGFLGSRGEKFAAELPGQRAETDKQTSELKALFKELGSDRLGAEIRNALEDAVNRLERTRQVREAVKALNISAADAIGHYTDMITSFLDAVARVTHLSVQGEMSRRLVAYVSFLRGKEQTGIERALLSNTFAQDAFGPGMYERFLSIVSAQDTYARVFLSLASHEEKAFYQKTLSGQAVEEVARLRRIALEKAGTGKFGVDPTYWFKTMTDKINLMKEVDNRLSSNLNALAGDLKTQARSVLVVLLGIAAVAVFVALTLAYLLARNITGSIGGVLVAANELAEGEGDLTRRIKVTGRDELGALARGFNTFLDKLHEIISQVRAAADHVATASQQLSAATEQLSSGAQEQASSLEETAASLEEITSTVKQNADNTRQASQLALGSRDTAEKGGQVVTAAVGSMGEINRSSKKIADIITTIDEIAFQTNLLALNAAVEAARAGEQGRGFAVVAAEVRNLAQRSATAAKEIKALIQDSVGKVKAGSELVNRSGQTLEEIVGSVKRVTDIIAEITAASQEQSTGIDQVNKAVTQMDQVTQSNAAQTEELSSTAQSLAAQAEELQALVGRFKLGEDAVVRGPAAAGPGPKATAKPAVGAKVARALLKRKPELALAGVGADDGSAHAKDDGFEEF